MRAHAQSSGMACTSLDLMNPPAATLARCYPHLVHDRAARYRQIGDVMLEPAYHRNPAFTVADFLAAIKAKGKKAYSGGAS